MRQWPVTLLPLVMGLSVCGTVGAYGNSATGSPCAVIENAAGRLIVRADGITLEPAVPGCPPVRPTGAPWWSLALEPAPGQPGVGGVILESSLQVRPIFRNRRDGAEILYRTLTNGREVYEISLRLRVRGSADAFEIGAEIRNRTEKWVGKAMTGPVLNGIRAELAQTPLLIPNGFGWRIRRAPAAGRDPMPWREVDGRLMITAEYPGCGGTMQWLAFAGESAGLYVGSHDTRFGAKTLIARYEPSDGTLGTAIRHNVFVRPGGRETLPPTRIAPYAGTWRAAARIYRGWVRTETERPVYRPEWAKTASGWLLAILKQQNGDIMWPYDRLGKLADIAEERGLDILGLFGWGYGGHDHLYPDYNPCPLMGGEAGLREGIRQAHDRGKRVILYANGQLLERGTAYWTETGRHLAVTSKDGSTVQEFWRKYGNTPGYRFDIGCQAARSWRERMLALAVQANALGADGILYDQLGMRAPTACYATGHGHPVPCMSYEADRKSMLREIAGRLRRINPDFIIMTEGFHDAVLDSVFYFHGCVLGMHAVTAADIAGRFGAPRAADIFPEMVRYVYPEVASTIRFPSPLLTRPMVNYTCAFGLRYEIESRYLPDRDYLAEGRIPAVSDYADVLAKPDIGLMRSLPPAETAAYQKRVAAFQKRHAPFLMTGTFTDEEGIVFTGAGIVAKGYQAGEQLGVVLWNTADRAAGFSLAVPGYRLVAAHEPEGEPADPFSPLPPQTVRLTVWERGKGM